jgi:hypothetical protein
LMMERVGARSTTERKGGLAWITRRRRRRRRRRGRRLADTVRATRRKGEALAVGVTVAVTSLRARAAAVSRVEGTVAGKRRRGGGNVEGSGEEATLACRLS